MNKILEKIKKNLIDIPKPLLYIKIVLVLLIIVINAYALLVDLKWTSLGCWTFSMYLIVLGIEDIVRYKKYTSLIISIIAAIIFYYIGLGFIK